MMKYLLSIIWLLLPGILGNIAPIIAKNIFRKRFATPIDFNKRFMGKPILGKNKTYRGFIAGILVSVLVVLIQSLLYPLPYIREISLYDYSDPMILVAGALMGFGTLLMDSVKSFFKRRLDIEPSKPWVPLDQMDMLLGYFVLVFPFFPIPPGYYLGVLIFSPLWAITSTNLGFFLRIKDTRW